jgi:prevent-host-death family protein
MIQIINISQARNNLAKLIDKVKETKKPVVIVQDSKPAVVIYPYEEILKNEEDKEELFEAQFQELLGQGKKIFKDYKNKNGLKKKLTEEEAYKLIKNA